MTSIETLAQRIRGRFPGATAVVDAPSRADAPWWLDVEWEGQKVVIEWRSARGFGLVSGPVEDYGEGLDEVYSSLAETEKRVYELLEKRQRTEPPRDVLLQRLRAIRRMSQEELAQRLKIRQAAVSKMERRSDMYVSTLQKVVQAMGGDLDIRARFPDAVVKISQFDGVSNDLDRRDEPQERRIDSRHWVSRTGPGDRVEAPASAVAPITSFVTNYDRVVVRALNEVIQGEDRPGGRHLFLDLLFGVNDNHQFLCHSRFILQRSNPVLNVLRAALFYLQRAFAPRLIGIEEPQRVNAEWNQLYFGHPGARSYLREYVYGLKALGVTRTDWEPPFSWHRERVGRAASYYFLLDAGQTIPWRSVGSYSIHSANGSMTLSCDVDRQGFLASDFLLLTRLPNPFKKGRFVVFVDGLHGVAMDAFAHLANGALPFDALKEAANRVRGHDAAFQTVLRINGISHDHHSNTTTFRDIEHVDTVSFNLEK